MAIHKPTTAAFLETVKARGRAIASGDHSRIIPQRAKSADGYPQRTKSVDGKKKLIWKAVADGSADVPQKKKGMQEALRPERETEQVWNG